MAISGDTLIINPFIAIFGIVCLICLPFVITKITKTKDDDEDWMY